jgi:hypothetical protein
MDTIATWETLEAARDIGDERARLTAPEAGTVTGKTTVPETESEAGIVRAAADEAESIVPDAVKTDASRRALAQRLASARARGIEWVRASDLLSRGSGRVAGAGIRFPQVAGIQTRRGLVNGVRAVSRRVRGLPPVSAFGRRSAMPVGSSRFGVGMR